MAHIKGTRTFSRQAAFTLIELLIVVAIIAILAAIAVPNFLEAQTRAKVTRIKADMRALSTALESYVLDHNNYPDRNPTNNRFIEGVRALTTPVAYIASVTLVDPFLPVTKDNPYDFPPGWKQTFHYVTYNGSWGKSVHPDYIRKGYVVSSFGPSRIQAWLEHYPYFHAHPTADFSELPSHADMLYDPTNGTKSFGGVGRAGGDFNCPQQLGG